MWFFSQKWKNQLFEQKAQRLTKSLIWSKIRLPTPGFSQPRIHLTWARSPETPNLTKNAKFMKIYKIFINLKILLNFKNSTFLYTRRLKNWGFSKFRKIFNFLKIFKIWKFKIWGPGDPCSPKHPQIFSVMYTPSPSQKKWSSQIKN